MVRFRTLALGRLLRIRWQETPNEKHMLRKTGMVDQSRESRMQCLLRLTERVGLLGANENRPSAPMHQDLLLQLPALPELCTVIEHGSRRVHVRSSSCAGCVSVSMQTTRCLGPFLDLEIL